MEALRNSSQSNKSEEVPETEPIIPKNDCILLKWPCFLAQNNSWSSYGTFRVSETNRVCFKTPEGKLIYAHNASEEDSIMNNNQFEERRNNAIANYFRAIEFLENNIDFPPESNIGLVDR